MVVLRKLNTTEKKVLLKYYQLSGTSRISGPNRKYNVIIVTYGNNGYNGHYGQKAWDTNWRYSYEQSKNRVRSVMRVYSRERF